MSISKLLYSFIILVNINTANCKTQEVEVAVASDFSNFNKNSGVRNGSILALEMNRKELGQKNIKMMLKEYNYGSSTIKALKVARDISKSKAVAVVGHIWSADALLAAPIYSSNKLPLMAPGATADRLSSYGNFIHLMCNNNSDMSEKMASFVKNKINPKKIFSITAQDCAYCVDLNRKFKLNFINTAISYLEYPILHNEMDENTLIKKIKLFKPDIIFLPNRAKLSANIMKISHNINNKIIFIGGDSWGINPQIFQKILGDRKVIGYSLAQWHPKLQTSSSLKFSTRYLEMFGVIPDDVAALTYDSTMFLISAMIKARSLDRGGIESSLKEIKKFKSISGSMSFDNGSIRSNRTLILKLDNEKNSINIVE